MTPMDGLDIHVIRVRSRHPNALPLLMAHGWTGSAFELLKVAGRSRIPRLTAGAHRLRFQWFCPRFQVAASPPRRRAGWNADLVARAWTELMKPLGYTRYLAQGGGWGRPDHRGDGPELRVASRPPRTPGVWRVRSDPTNLARAMKLNASLPEDEQVP